jgi:hypothetical protein
MTMPPNKSLQATRDDALVSPAVAGRFTLVGPACLSLWTLAHMRYLLSLFLLVLLTGCETGYGIYRHARVPFMPAPAIVGTVVRETPGVDDVQYHYAEGGRPLTWTGIHSPDQVHTFFYRGGTNVSGSLMFIVDYKGTVEYSQSLMMHQRPPQERIDATHPVMLQIESRLERDCGLTNLSSTVKETLDGVRLR